MYFIVGMNIRNYDVNLITSDTAHVDCVAVSHGNVCLKNVQYIKMMMKYSHMFKVKLHYSAQVCGQ